MNKKILYILVSIVLLGTSCSESWLDQDPKDSFNESEAITTVAKARYAVDGVYNHLTSSEYYNSDFIAQFDVMADDMRASESGRLASYYRYTFYTESSETGMWSRPYKALKNVANVLDRIDAIEAASDDEANELKDLKGQALALRALIHWDLVRVFGLPYTHVGGPEALGIPMVLSPVADDAKPPRNTVGEVYTQVVKDFEAGILLLSESKYDGHINAWAAKALLSRVFLYMGDNDKALSLAKDVIDNSGLSLMPRDKYIESWESNMMDEALFELINNAEDHGGLESVGYLSDPDGYGQFIASDTMIYMMSERKFDIRSQLLAEDELSKSDAPHMGRVMKYPGKKNLPSYTSNIRVIRLSEVYLIAAEAALTSDKTKAAEYLNEVIKRAYPTDDVRDTDGTVIFTASTDVPVVTEANIDLDRVLLERRLELVAEGHRFFDLIRNKKDIIRDSGYWGNSTYETVKFDSYKIIQPIPRIELDVNPLTQNPGYDS